MKLKFKKKPRYKKILIVLGIILSLVAGSVIFSKGGLRSLLEARRKNREIKQEIEKLGEENHQLEDEIQDLRGNPVAIERLAREQMRMAKPNEIILAIPDGQGQDTNNLTPIREGAGAHQPKHR